MDRLREALLDVRRIVQSLNVHGVPRWALARYGETFSKAPGLHAPGGETPTRDLPFGMVEGTVATLEAARELMSRRSSPSNTYILGIIEVVAGGDVAYQVVRFNEIGLPAHRDWRDGKLSLSRTHDGVQATLRLVDTDEVRAGGRRNG